MRLLCIFAFSTFVNCLSAFPSESDTVISKNVDELPKDVQFSGCADHFVYIPYGIADEFPKDSLDEIHASLTYYENKTRLRFKKIQSFNVTDPLIKPNSPILYFRFSSKYYYDHLFDIDGGYFTTREKVERLISEVFLNDIFPTFDAMARIKQHMFYALGFLPENLRSDRDDYVTVLWDNIQPDFKKLFDKKNNATTRGFKSVFSEESVEATSKFPYDLRSISHYYPTDFSKNGKNTLISKDEKLPLQQNTELSPLDVEKIHIRYCDKRTR